MTDLVERLNDAARLFEEHGDHKSLPREAADEIERLRAALQKITAIEDSYTGGDWDEIEEVRLIARDALA